MSDDDNNIEINRERILNRLGAKKSNAIGVSRELRIAANKHRNGYNVVAIGADIGKSDGDIVIIKDNGKARIIELEADRFEYESQ